MTKSPLILSVASGKGGTGKTTLATALALSLEEPVQFLDCDVEEPNGHIFLKPEITSREEVFIPVPEVDEKACTHCGLCQEVCEYNAIAVLKKRVMVFPELCHGCGACSLLCPEKAIKEVGKGIGVVELGAAASRNGSSIRFGMGLLNVGEAMSPPLIRSLKEHIDEEGIVVLDVPPGTSCPVITAVTGSDYCILVTEPTPFGLNDLVLAVEALNIMGIPYGVVVNRAGIGDGKVEDYCRENGIEVLLKIPFDRGIAEAYSRGIPLTEARPRYAELLREVIDKIGEKITG